jgi:hypothetical protein
MVDLSLIYKNNLSEQFLANAGSKTLNRILKLLLLLELAYDLTQTRHQPRKFLCLLFDEADFRIFDLFFLELRKTAKVFALQSSTPHRLHFRMQ